jgi:acyl-CoA reductase-like NAD-dependent aldehyde dehydrogenase
MYECKMLIGGKWVDADSGKTFETINPATMEKLSKVPKAGKSDVDKAVSAARAAFPAWSQKTLAQRRAGLKSIASKIRERAEELAMCDVMEHGTPYKDAFGVCMGAADKFDYNASIAQALMGTHIPMEEGKLSYFRREPFGVAALIIPWNLPVIMMAVKMSAVIAVGNTCVIKPPSTNSMTCLKMAEIIQSAGVPDGVFNVVTGGGEEVGRELCVHPGVDIIGFYRQQRNRQERAVLRGKYRKKMRNGARRQQPRHNISRCGPRRGHSRACQPPVQQLRAALLRPGQILRP